MYTQKKLQVNVSNQSFQVGGKSWEMMIGDTVFRLDATEVSQLEALVNAFPQCFSDDGNYMRIVHRVPSPLLRIDYVLHGGMVRAYEIEERPAGIGIMSRLYPELFAKILSVMRKSAEGNLAFLVSDRRASEGADDLLLDGMHGIRVYRESDLASMPESHCIWPRVSRDESHLYYLTPRCLAPIAKEGDKSYGPLMLLWQQFPEMSLRTYDWWKMMAQRPFVYKPLAGSRFDGVLVYRPNRGQGTSSIGKIQSAVDEYGGYMQDYHPHETWDFLPGGYALLRRVFVGWDIKQRRYRVLGGFWVAVMDVRGHGTKHAITGQILLP